MDTLKTHIRHVPDFPKAGILFYDVTTLLQGPAGLQAGDRQHGAAVSGLGITLVVGIESRGFILGAAVADRIGAGFVPVRKLGKLPAADDSRHLRPRIRQRQPRDAPRRDRASGQKVLIVDDLLATGGTARATVDLVRQLGADVVGIQFLIELLDLKGRERLTGENVRAVLQY